MPLVSCLYDRFVNFLLGEFGVCGASRFRSTSSPESVSDSRPPSISSEALPYFSCNSLDDGPGFLDRSAVSSSSLYLLATLFANARENPGHVRRARVLWVRGGCDVGKRQQSSAPPTASCTNGLVSSKSNGEQSGKMPEFMICGPVSTRTMWRRLLRGAEVWEDRERTVLVTEASPGRWIRPAHEEDDLVSCANPCVECEPLEDRCVGWVDVRDLQLSAPEPEEHALRASRRYRGHRGCCTSRASSPSSRATSREPARTARYKRGGTVGPLFDAAGFVQAAFANASARPVHRGTRTSSTTSPSPWTT